jgi:para-nitrobenzyl esterase
MPAADGLFHRAIIQSGPALRVTKPERATSNAEGVLASLGADADIDRLWSASADELLAAASAAGRMGLSPVLDPATIPEHPVHAFTTGAATDVPVIVGCNRDEGAGGLPRSLDDDGLRERLAQMSDTDDGDVIDRMVATYRHQHTDASLVDLLSFAITDQRMRAGSIQLAEARTKGSSAPVWQYFFTYQMAGRAGHGYEIAFCLDNLGGGGTAPSEGRRKLADEMSEAWIAFARQGDPNHEGLTEWPPFTVPDRETMIFGPTSEVVDDPSRSTRELWEELAAARRRR